MDSPCTPSHGSTPNAYSGAAAAAALRSQATPPTHETLCRFEQLCDSLQISVEEALNLPIPFNPHTDSGMRCLMDSMPNYAGRSWTMFRDAAIPRAVAADSIRSNLFRPFCAAAPAPPHQPGQRTQLPMQPGQRVEGLDPATLFQRNKIMSLCQELDLVPDYAWDKCYWSKTLASRTIQELKAQRAATPALSIRTNWYRERAEWAGYTVTPETTVQDCIDVFRAAQDSRVDGKFQFLTEPPTDRQKHHLAYRLPPPTTTNFETRLDLFHALLARCDLTTTAQHLTLTRALKVPDAEVPKNSADAARLIQVRRRMLKLAQKPTLSHSYGRPGKRTFDTV